MTSYSMGDYLAAPLLTGAFSAVGTMILAPEVNSVNLPLVNAAMPASLGIGLVSMASDMIGTGAAGYVLPKLGMNNEFNKMIPPLATAGANALLLTMGGNDGPIGKIALITGGSSAAATYVKQNYL